ncbi:Ankyrin repeat domain-containing protein 29-like [Arapaima gigas]
MSFKKETPLANAVFWAARRGNLALLQLLLNSGRVDADCKDSVGLLHAEASQLHALTVPECGGGGTRV